MNKAYSFKSKLKSVIMNNTVSQVQIYKNIFCKELSESFIEVMQKM